MGEKVISSPQGDKWDLPPAEAANTAAVVPSSSEG